MNELMTTLAGTAETILTGLLALLTVYATRWIGAATARARAANDQIEDAQFRDFANEALDRVDDLATKTVARIEQTTAKAMRELIKAGSGPYTEDDLKALGQRAVEEIISSLSPDYKDAIVRTVGSLERYVTSTVEAKVLELKNQPQVVREPLRCR